MESESLKVNNNEFAVNNAGIIHTTKRAGMDIQNMGEAILDKIIDMQAKTDTLPITMRKLYAYKIKNEPDKEQKPVENKPEKTARDIKLNSATVRESMLLNSRTDTILDELINLKVSTKMLPITMRKLYAYKVVSINKKLRQRKVVPLVLRKKAMYEKLIHG